MISTASPSHIDEIKALWQQSFGDEPGYIDSFLERFTTPDNTLVWLDGGVCGMLFILPCTLALAHERYRCAYLCGVATRQSDRGRGISTALLQYAYELCAARGYQLCALVPASHSLFNFYAKRGYALQGYVKTLSLVEQELDLSAAPVFSAIGAEEVFALRKSFFGGAYMAWDKQMLVGIIEENSSLGGCFYRYSLGVHSGYISCVPQGDALLVKEFCGTEALLPCLLGGLHKIYGKQRYRVRLSNVATIGELTPLAMTHWITKRNEQPFYLSHVFD